MAKLQRILRDNPLTISQIATQLKTSNKDVREQLKDLKDRHIKVYKTGHKFYTSNIPVLKSNANYVSREDNTFTFGATGDWHLASKYERLDVLYSLYEAFEAAEVDRVFHTGNYVDGKMHFNTHDLKVIGLDAQLQYMADNYPNTDLETYAVSGNDHEGWWAKREGIDIGAYTERVMRDNDIDNWHDLGYMEAFVNLKNVNSGKKAEMVVCHPGGGSSYAQSYRIQKIVESYDPDEKPAVGLYGHYHKLSYNFVGGVHAIQTGCTQDQTPFMRQKLIDAHVGGVIVQLTQDPKTGFITSCTQRFLHYKVKEKVNGRWSMSNFVELPRRG